MHVKKVSKSNYSKENVIGSDDRPQVSYLDFKDPLYLFHLVTVARLKSLVSLKLECVRLPILHGSYVSDERLFPSLKTLSVKAAKFYDLDNLLFECPSMEYLSLTECAIGNSMFYVCCSSLKYQLEVKYCPLDDIRVDQALSLEIFTFVSLPKSNCEKIILNSAFNLKYVNISAADEYIKEFSLLGCHRTLEASIISKQVHRFEFFDGYLSANLRIKADQATILVGEFSDQEWFSSDSTYVPRLVSFLRRFSCCKKINIYIQNVGALTIPHNYRKMTSLPPLPKTKTLEVRIPNLLKLWDFYETLQWIAPSARILIKRVDVEEDRKKADQRSSYALGRRY